MNEFFIIHTKYFYLVPGMHFPEIKTRVPEQKRPPSEDEGLWGGWRVKRSLLTHVRVSPFRLCLFFVSGAVVVFRYGAVFTVPMFGKNITFLVGPEAQAPFFKLNVRRL